MKELVNAVVSILRCAVIYNDMFSEFESYSDILGLKQNMYDKPQKYINESEAITGFKSAADNFFVCFCDNKIDELEAKFIEIANSDEQLSVFGISTKIEPKDAKSIFDKTIDVCQSSIKTADTNIDGFAYFSEILRDIVGGYEYTDTNSCDANASLAKCPYCDGTPEIIDQSIFFGDDSLCDEGNVCACMKCGAYAFLDKDGNAIGIIADKKLHEKRNKVKQCISEYCELVGVTLYESRKVFSSIVKKKIISKNDIEFLNVDECNAIIHKYLVLNDNICKLKVKYPSNHKTLMEFFEKGGRVRIENGLTTKNNHRLLIPVSVGNSAITVKSSVKQEVVQFPKSLNYKFNGNTLEIIHPSGNIETLKMYPHELKEISL